MSQTTSTSADYYKAPQAHQEDLDEVARTREYEQKLKAFDEKAQAAKSGTLTSVFQIAMNWRNPQAVLQGIASFVMGTAQHVAASSEKMLYQIEFEEAAARRAQQTPPKADSEVQRDPPAILVAQRQLFTPTVP